MKTSIVLTLAIVVFASSFATSQDSAKQTSQLLSVKQGRHCVTPQSAAEMQQLFRFTGVALPLVSAHRGGPKVGLPENCIATFEDTLAHTFSMLEIDPRLTKDGELVVLHDPSLERTTNGMGLVADTTWSELQKLYLRDTQGNVTDFRIPKLDEVFQWARGKTILVLDQKDVPLDTRIKKIEQHRAESYAMLIVANVKDAQIVNQRNPDIMMEVFIDTPDKYDLFEQARIPWSNLIAFVGHKPPENKALLERLHAKGVMCMAGTSRNLDREFTETSAQVTTQIEPQYRQLLDFGVDIIETDIPREVGRLLYGKPK